MHPIRLVPSHAAQYRALMLEAYARQPEAFTSSAAERAALPIAWWEERLGVGEAPREVVWGCLRDGALVGVCGMAFETREKVRHKATLFGMYVAPQFRNLGLGSRLVCQSLAYARARTGLLVVQLTVSSGNAAAQSLYARHGFVQFGLEPLAVAVGSAFVAKSHMWCHLESTSA